MFSAAEKTSLFFLSLEIFLATWLCSGTRPEFLLPMLFAAVCAFAPLASECGGAFGKPVYLKNPAFLCGVFLCTLAAIQYFNPAYARLTDEGAIRIIALEHAEFLPSGIAADFASGNALFSMAAILAASLSSAAAFILFSRGKFVKYILTFFALNCVAMAIFAVAQKALKIPIMYDCVASDSDCYGTFFASNSAGAFLNLGAAACAAIAFAAIKSRVGKFFAAAFWTVCAAICLYAVFDSASRGAQFAGTGFAAFCAVAFVVSLLKTARARIFASIFICSALVAFFASITSTLKSDSKIAEAVSQSLSSRISIQKIGAQIFSENPIFGTGANSFGYLATPHYFEKEHSYKTGVRSVERAHCDILEAAVEFGSVGLAAIFAALGAGVLMFFKKLKKLSIANVVLFAGAALCALHSSIDVHMHVPSAFTAFVLVATISLFPIGNEEGSER